MLQTDFLSIPPNSLDKASIRSRSHEEEVSKLVDQSTNADSNPEERRKSETDLTAALPGVESAVDTSDMRFIEREVCVHVPITDPCFPDSVFRSSLHSESNMAYHCMPLRGGYHQTMARTNV